MYQRILVATDGSPWADAAVDYAIALASQPGSELWVLTVVPAALPWVAPFDVSGSSSYVLEAVERRSQGLLARVVDRAAQLDVVCRPMCTWGAVAETILHTASVENCDLIILGSRQARGWKRLLLEGTCNTVAAKASQPVLIVKQPPQLTFDFPLWRRLLVATGESRSSDAAVAHAITLAQSEAVELHLLYVESGRPSLGDPVVMSCSEGERVLIVTEARAAAAGVVSDPCLAAGHITKTILETARDRRCDVIILGSRRATGWKRFMVGSIACAVAARASQPVLIVKPG
jgi:nucleotide-binding universal stress UspA family protein